MKVGFVKVKDWFINKTQNVAGSYNCFIDIYSRDEERTVMSENGYYTVIVKEVLKETEKAVQVKLGTGDIVGSYKGWTTWTPKSCISE